MYCCHPVGGDVAGNVKRALDWLRFLRASEPNIVIIAPWLASLASGEDDNDPAQREHGLRDAEAVVARCDGVILVGGRVSSGMQREIDAAITNGLDVYNLTSMGTVAPTEPHRDGLGLARDNGPRASRHDRTLRLVEAAQELAELRCRSQRSKSAADHEADPSTWTMARSEAQGRFERAARAVKK